MNDDEYARLYAAFGELDGEDASVESQPARNGRSLRTATTDPDRKE